MAGLLASALLGGAAGGFSAMGTIASENIKHKQELAKEAALAKRMENLERIRNQFAVDRQEDEQQFRSSEAETQRGFLAKQNDVNYERQADAGYVSPEGTKVTEYEYNRMSEEDKKNLTPLNTYQEQQAEKEINAKRGEMEFEYGLKENLEKVKQTADGDGAEAKRAKLFLNSYTDAIKAEIPEMMRLKLTPEELSEKEKQIYERTVKATKFDPGWYAGGAGAGGNQGGGTDLNKYFTTGDNTGNGNKTTKPDGVLKPEAAKQSGKNTPTQEQILGKTVNDNLAAGFATAVDTPDQRTDLDKSVDKFYDQQTLEMALGELGIATGKEQQAEYAKMYRKEFPGKTDAEILEIIKQEIQAR